MIPYGKQEVSYTYPKGEGSLRVLTFNIRHCAGNDDVINYDRTAAVINGMEPDVVCLQEVDYMTTRSNKVDQLKTLADKTGMNYYFSKSIAYQGGEYGNGLFVVQRDADQHEDLSPSRCRTPFCCHSRI